jgi:predicted ester cyclase
MLGDSNTTETATSMRLIRRFLFDGLNNFDQQNLSSMAIDDFFHRDLKWYGPGGIGACLSLEEFQKYHQQPWLAAYPDRKVQDLDSLFADGRFAAASGWAGVKAKHQGCYLSTEATGNTIDFNGMDFWLRRDDKFIENWVFVDMIDVFRQLGIDLLQQARNR